MGNIIRRIVSAFAVLFLLTTLVCGCSTSESKVNAQVKIGVTVYDQYDTFISELMDCFNSDAEEGVTVETFNASKSQQSQNEQVQSMIDDGCNVICVNLVDRTAPTEIIDMARKCDIPVMFFNRELVEEDLQRWDKLYYVGADAFESGILEGELAATTCKSDATVDKNGDGVIQYVVLEGEAGHQDAIVRTEYSVNTLLGKGVCVDKIGYAMANWNRTQAQTKVSQMIDQQGDNIELIMANNDDMALGAIDAYKAKGILRSKWPAIFGIDGTDEGLEAVKKDEMIGTVYNDKEGQAQAMMNLAVALSKGEDLDSLGLTDGKYIRLPYQKVTAANVNNFLD